MTQLLQLKNRRLLAFLGLITTGLLVLVALGLKATHKTLPALNVIAADANVQQVASANTDFGLRLLKQLNRETPTQNIFFSPFSVSDALTMTWNGAGGATQTDMATTLGLHSMTLSQVNQANGLLLPSQENPDPKVEVSVANALWAGNDSVFQADFQARCHQFYEARIDTLDFGSPAAADTINGWVKDNTHGKIDTIVSASDLAGAVVVLTNAVYFHGPWKRPFDRSATQDGPFQIAQGGNVTVPLMSQEGSLLLPGNTAVSGGQSALWHWACEFVSLPAQVKVRRSSHGVCEWTEQKFLGGVDQKNAADGTGYGVGFWLGGRLHADGPARSSHQQSGSQSGH